MREIEDDAVKLVLDQLGREGTITSLRRPDRDAALRPELMRRPDAVFVFQGEPTALEVTIFVPNRNHGTAIARVDAIRRRAESLLAGATVPGLVMVTLRYNTADEGILALKGEALEAVSTQLAVAVREALAEGLRIGASDRPLPRLPAYLRAEISHVISPARRLVLGAAPEGGDLEAGLDSWIANTVAKKGNQHIGWGRGILAVQSTFVEDAEDFEPAFHRWQDRGGSVPWWRVYVVHFAGHTVDRVWPPRRVAGHF